MIQWIPTKQGTGRRPKAHKHIQCSIPLFALQGIIPPPFHPPYLETSSRGWVIWGQQHTQSCTATTMVLRMCSFMRCHFLQPYHNGLSPCLGLGRGLHWHSFGMWQGVIKDTIVSTRLIHVTHVEHSSSSPLPLPDEMCLLHCALITTTTWPAFDTSSDGTNSKALRALLSLEVFACHGARSWQHKCIIHFVCYILVIFQ